MAATQRDSFYPADRTQSQFLPIKVFRPKCESGYQEGDRLNSKLIGKSEVMEVLNYREDILTGSDVVPWGKWRKM